MEDVIKRFEPVPTDKEGRPQLRLVPIQFQYRVRIKTVCIDYLSFERSKFKKIIVILNCLLKKNTV